MGITVTLSATGTSDVSGSESYQVSHTKTTSSVVTARKVQIVVPVGSEVDILSFSTTVTGLAVSAITKLIIINRSSADFCRIRIEDAGTSGHTFDQKLPADDFTVINTRDIEVRTTVGVFSSFNTADTVSAQADTTPQDLEILVFHT